jgi:hypothetical protein
MHPMVHRGDEAKLKLSPFGDSITLTQDRCTVCVEHTIGLELILDTPKGTPM